MMELSTHSPAPIAAPAPDLACCRGCVGLRAFGSRHPAYPVRVYSRPQCLGSGEFTTGAFAPFSEALALHLASRAGELDTATLAEALGQDPAHPSAAAFRTVARETLRRLERAGLLIRRGRAPAFFWSPPRD